MPIERVASHERVLSSDERERATRFHFERDRSRFIVGRGMLRMILSSYLKIDPGHLNFIYSPKGKPMLTGLRGDRTPFFNLSHSSDLILFALTRACAVGIDVEWSHLMEDYENIASHFFSRREVTELKKRIAVQ